VRTIETYAAAVKGVAESAAPTAVDVRPDDVAFLQFTSGSTSRPKGVTLTHANLMANIAAIGAAQGGLDITGEAYGVSWLPLYHDMGLIGFVFTPVVHRARGIRFISPLMFLKRPSIWLRQISECRGTITFAPNFAYGLCTTRVKEAELTGVDLSSLVIAGCGAEPIQAATLRAFADRYAAYGFRSAAFLPTYGMAEHSLAVSFIDKHADFVADRIDAASLAQKTAAPAREGEPAASVVGCGRPFAGHGLRIVDAAGRSLPDREVGQILLQGPSVMQGYWNDPERTAEALRGGWLATGDLGYTVDGELFVCGRMKDLIIVHGRNYHPQDIEWQASQVEGVRRGNVIAFGVQPHGEDRERVVVAAEVRQLPEDPAEQEKLRGEICAAGAGRAVAPRGCRAAAPAGRAAEDVERQAAAQQGGGAVRRRRARQGHAAGRRAGADQAPGGVALEFYQGVARVARRVSQSAGRSSNWNSSATSSMARG
jgi:fatty-acyl-CoA synthase